MAKKKLSLKPVQRGFATTSVASRKPDPPTDAPKESPEESKQEDKAQKSVEDGVKPLKPEASLDDWEDEDAIERNALQGLVDRLQERGEKEVTRIVKALDFDRRLAVSFPKVEINQAIRDEALQMAVVEETAGVKDASVPSIKTFPTVQVTEADKGLLRFFIAYLVLQKLGFNEDRIQQCLLEGVEEGAGWEEALEWMWLHLSEDECLGQGEYARKEEPDLQEPEESLIPAVIETPLRTEPEPSPPVAPETATTSSTVATSLFQSQTVSDSESESDSEGALNLNEQWAKCQLELDNLRIVSGGSKKGKKGKGNGVVFDTPEIKSLKEKITKIEKEYIFSRKSAEATLKVMKSQRDISAIAAKFKKVAVQDAPSTTVAETPASDSGLGDAEEEGTPDILNCSDDEGEGGLFGGLLGGSEPEADMQPSAVNEDNSTITIRPMPIPKQLSFAGTIPKNVLTASLNKQTKQCVISYVNLSGASRAARCGLEVRWEGKRKIWKMEELACDDMREAENYVATLALSDLEADKTLTGVNWRTMPSAYRELWEELTVKRKEREDEKRRGIWKLIKGLWDQKAVEKPVEKVEVTRNAGTGLPLKQEASVREKNDVFVAKLCDDLSKRVQSAAYQSMLQQRNTLPIASFRDQILGTIDANQMMVFSGETGCGKSTQLPSYILEDQLSKGRPCKIVVTEPRRISAISLAQRVSQELGDAPNAVGTLSSLVGYSIRLESKTSANTRLSFVTNGIALRMLESGSSGGSKGTAFDEVTHIIVDEVHERSIESDFLLIVLKKLCETRKDLKVVLMSATVDAEKLSNFFGGCPFMSVPGRTFPVRVNYLEDAVELSGWHIDESSPYAIRGRKFKPANQMVQWNEEGAKSDSDPEDDDEESTSNPAKLSSTMYSAETVGTINLLDSRQIPYDLIVSLLEKICYHSAEYRDFSRATLVFMPGLAEIRKLNDMLLAHPQFGSQDFVVWPLHSSISSEGQSAVFQTPHAGVRKIVISTNIAETGVTIPDITCVIDTGKQREMRYDEKRQLSRFVESYVARSNAKQRRGRAGRVQEGLAFHLFTKARHDTQLADHPIPEMLRLSLQDLALRIKILKIPLGKTIESVLLQALDPPSAINIQRAVSSLVEVKALTSTEEITPLGKLLSKLPMDVHLGKFLLVAAMFGCLDPALTIAATLNSKSPFVTPFGFESQAKAAKASFAVGNSDFLTIANVFMSWRRVSDNPHFVRTFCQRNYVSHQNLQQIEELRQQLLAYLIDTSFVEATPAQRQAISQSRFSRGVRTRFVPVPSELNVHGEDFKVIGAALVSGLYPRLLLLDPNGGLKTTVNQQPIAIHPSSVNFKLPYKEFGSNYLVYFTIMQSKRLYAWETGPVEDMALALLCGDVADLKVSVSSFILDRKIKFNISPKSAMAIKLIREHFAQAMSLRFRGKRLTETQKKWFELGLRLLSAEPEAEEQLKIGVV